MSLRFAVLTVATLVVAGCMGAGPGPDVGSQGTPSPPTNNGVSPASTGTGEAGTTSQPASQQTACHGSGTVPLTTLPMALGDFATLLPYGTVVGGHVTPIDHMYFTPADWPGHRDEYEVHAIADGQIVDIQTRPSTFAPGSTASSVEYRIWIDHTCTFHSYVDLVTSLSPRLLEWYNAYKTTGGRDATRLSIQAGELMGKIGGQTLDFGVYNDDKTLPGLLVPEHYVRESWKIHTDDPFLYFTEPVRSQLLAKDVRNAEPRCGKIDYDVEGRAVGNWFLQGTNGYAGANPSNPYDYWSGHLSLSPDAYIPSHLIASMGNWSGEARQFAVKGNAPDFAGVDQAAGAVKYELVRWSYADGDDSSALPFNSFPHPMAHPVAVNGPDVEGVLLIQVTGPRILKVETFPGKTAADVMGFDGAARTYER
jgi:hypothetical protein